MIFFFFLHRFQWKKHLRLTFVCLLLGFPFNSQSDCHENELLICFPKEFLMPHRSDSLSEMVVVWSTNNFPGLHCLSKAFFHAALIMWKMPLSKVPLLFFSHKDVRWRKLEFPNMLICLSVNSTPSSTVLESSFSIFEISCAWVTQVCLSSQDAICPLTETKQDYGVTKFNRTIHACTLYQHLFLNSASIS